MSWIWLSSSAICSWVMGRPCSASALARATHSRRQVRNLLSSEKMYCISRLAYRVEKGLL